MKKKKAVYTGKPRLRKGDSVVVLTGRNRGSQGKILRVLPTKGRVIVEGINVIKRATKANPQKNIKGGIVEREAPIAISNVQFLDPEKQKPTRVGIRLEGDERVRFARKSGVTVSAVASRARE